MPREGVRIRTKTILVKFFDPDNVVYREARKGCPISALKEMFPELFRGERVVHGNLFLEEGINLIWTAVCGGSFTPFDNNNAHIGVGDGTDPEDYSQTGLTGANKYYKKVDTGYPVYGSGRKAVFRATFGADEANFTWNEWTVANGPGDDYVNLNRKVENLGTKTQGSTWILTVELYIG
ncbi:MAG: hypothetical protein DRJ38_06240 [Thermoprotei archaeon]|nr:MAG: hypothetical protein DRJ38_06240 [Thermoprotei archaeon]